MRILVAYYSLTGNTLKVAEAIFDEIPEPKEIKPLDEIQSLEGFDLTFVGFPILQFGPPPPIRAFLENQGQSRNIALFVTHASWRSPELSPMLDSWLRKCKAAASGVTLLGFFDCQGELSEASAELLINSEIPQIRYFGSLRHMTIGHPDITDLENARQFARDIISDK
ncbi:MAG: flavodoxin family protein [bacterium]